MSVSADLQEIEALYNQGKYMEALGKAEICFKFHPSNPRLLALRAFVVSNSPLDIQEKVYSDFNHLRELRKALVLDDQRAETLIDLGNFFYECGQENKAKEQYRKAFKHSLHSLISSVLGMSKCVANQNTDECRELKTFLALLADRFRKYISKDLLMRCGDK